MASAARYRPRTCHINRILLSAVLPFLSLPLAFAQPARSVAIWEVPSPKAQAMLSAVPSTDAERYLRLRQYFAEYGCSADRMTEQPLSVSDNRRAQKHGAIAGRNLICRLPGSSREEILVVAWYPVRTIYNGASTSWPEAVMLPMLYHALQAQPHYFTFVFAELADEDGQRHFMDEMRTMHIPAPIALIALAGLGMTPPWFFSASADELSRDRRPVQRILEEVAAQLAEMQHLPTAQVRAFNLPKPIAVPATPLDHVRGIPRILFCSQPGQQVSFTAFRQDHDFVAFYLAALDMKLNPLNQTLEDAPLTPPLHP